MTKETSCVWHTGCPALIQCAAAGRCLSIPKDLADTQTEVRPSKQCSMWHRANAVEVPDVPQMIDHPGDTVSCFLAISDGFRVGRARWHYPTKSWCHKGSYDGNVLFWSLVPNWDRTSDETTRDDAAKWRALRNCARITAMGCAGLTQPHNVADDYAHLTLNFWTGVPDGDPGPGYAREWLDSFVAKALRAMPPEEPAGRTAIEGDLVPDHWWRVHRELANGHTSAALAVVAAVLEGRPLPECSACNVTKLTINAEKAGDNHGR